VPEEPPGGLEVIKVPTYREMLRWAREKDVEIAGGTRPALGGKVAQVGVRLCVRARRACVCHTCAVKDCRMMVQRTWRRRTRTPLNGLCQSATPLLPPIT
jgi:hypothetical protein